MQSFEYIFKHIPWVILIATFESTSAWLLAFAGKVIISTIAVARRIMIKVVFLRINGDDNDKDKDRSNMIYFYANNKKCRVWAHKQDCESQVVIDECPLQHFSFSQLRQVVCETTLSTKQRERERERERERGRETDKYNHTKKHIFL